MKSITNQKQAQALQRLPFCYLCGKSFSVSCSVDREHVVARNLFRKSDRENFPLILPSHTICNGEQSCDDETIGQFVRLLHPEGSKTHKIELTGYYEENTLQAGTIRGVAFERVIWRWVRGFHSALYQEPLLNLQGSYTLLVPLQEVREEEGVFERVPVREQFFQMTEVIKVNRLSRNIDVIDCYNHALRYECVWDRSDCGKPLCVFALKIYDWSELGEGYGGARQGCVGSYIYDKIPPEATQGINLSCSLGAERVLDPFKK